MNTATCITSVGTSELKDNSKYSTTEGGLSFVNLQVVGTAMSASDRERSRAGKWKMVSDSWLGGYSS